MENTLAINEFVLQFTENYSLNIIEDDVVGFYNDAFLLLQHFYEMDNSPAEFDDIYSKLINHIIKYQHVFNEYQPFDFNCIKTLSDLRLGSEFQKLTPIYTSYSFKETEETIEQILEELQTAKEFQKELKEEVNYLLDEYCFHTDHLNENIQYNFLSTKN